MSMFGSWRAARPDRQAFAGDRSGFRDALQDWRASRHATPQGGGSPVSGPISPGGYPANPSAPHAAQLTPFQQAQAYALSQGGGLSGGSAQGMGVGNLGNAMSAGTMGGMGGFTPSGVSLGGTSPNLSGGYMGGNLGNLGTAPTGGFLSLGNEDKYSNPYGYQGY